MRIDTTFERHQWAGFAGVALLVVVVWTSLTDTHLPASLEWAAMVSGTVLGGLGLGYHQAVRNHDPDVEARALTSSRRRSVLLQGSFWGAFPHAMVGAASPPVDATGSFTAFVPGWVLVLTWGGTVLGIVVAAIRSGRRRGERLRDVVTRDSP